jgi:hypothetical protein
MKKERILGVAFLIQAIASLVSGAFFLKPLVVEGNIVETMQNISNHENQMRLVILGDTITAMGIVFLGAMLYKYLHKYNSEFSLTAFGLYLIEAIILMVSRIFGFALLIVSQEAVSSGFTENAKLLGKIFFDTMDYSYNLMMIPFCIGAIIFYSFMYKSEIISRKISLWGIITIFPMIIGTIIILFGNDAPMILYVFYIPFEFFIGIWILFVGVKNKK